MSEPNKITTAVDEIMDDIWDDAYDLKQRIEGEIKKLLAPLSERDRNKARLLMGVRLK